MENLATRFHRFIFSLGIGIIVLITIIIFFLKEYSDEIVTNIIWLFKDLTSNWIILLIFSPILILIGEIFIFIGEMLFIMPYFRTNWGALKTSEIENLSITCSRREKVLFELAKELLSLILKKVKEKISPILKKIKEKSLEKKNFQSEEKLSIETLENLSIESILTISENSYYLSLLFAIITTYLWYTSASVMYKNNQLLGTFYFILPFFSPFLPCITLFLFFIIAIGFLLTGVYHIAFQKSLNVLQWWQTILPNLLVITLFLSLHHRGLANKLLKLIEKKQNQQATSKQEPNT